MTNNIKISDYDYDLPEERIAKFPAGERDASKLLVYRAGEISDTLFRDVGGELPPGAMLVFNDTKVIRARLVMHKPTGGRVEVFCLEPHSPADYERAFAADGSCEWSCIVGGLKKWKGGALEIPFEHDGARHTLRAWNEGAHGRENIVRFEWDSEQAFGQLLEHLGRIPIPPYLNRETEEIDYERYQTVYSRFEGSVAAPTAGLHFTPELIGKLKSDGFTFGEVTLHVGAGTFLPVKEDDVAGHAMHTEHFEVERDFLRRLIANGGKIIPVGTTSVRTLESLPMLGWRLMRTGTPCAAETIGQWEAYGIPADMGGKELLANLVRWMESNGVEKLKASTQIMIAPGFRFRVTEGMITNFHQPRSTLLLLVSAFIGEDWRKVYGHALAGGFRFLSYGDSSLLLR